MSSTLPASTIRSCTRSSEARVMVRSGPPNPSAIVASARMVPDEPDHLAEAARAVGRRELLELHLDLGRAEVPALARDLAFGEEAQRAGHAADPEALGLEHLRAFADDELRAAAADVDHEPARARGRQAAVDAEVDQARLLAARHHLDAVPERGLRREQERARRLELAHGLRRHRAHLVLAQAAQALAEAREAAERVLLARGLERAVLAQAHGQAHRLAQAVEHARGAALVARHQQMEAVRAQVDGCDLVAFLERAAIRHCDPQSRAKWGS
jgi:hypothetical protein